MINTKSIVTILSLFLSQSFLIPPAFAEIPADLLNSAKRGDANAQYSVARSYQLGKRVKSDKKKALEWYAKAADQGHLEAAYRLGLIYYKGIGGYKIDLEKGFKYISQAAKKNHKRSQTHLAKMYENGDGVEKSEVLSDYWYEQAFSSNIQSLDEYLRERGDDDEETVIAVVKELAPVEQNIERRQPAKSVSSSNNLEFPDSVLSQKWTQKGKPSDLLKSTTTKCKNKGEKIACTSGKLSGLHSTGPYRYKVKSIIKKGSTDKEITIVYKKLYISVPEVTVGGYDDIEEQVPANNQRLTAGWEKASHTVICQFETDSSILCRPVGEDAFYIKAK